MISASRVIISGFLALCVASACTADAPANARDGGQCGPMDGGGAHKARYALPTLGHDHGQSPINILSAETTPGRHRITTHYEHADPNRLLNTGGTIELDFPTGASVDFDGRTFALKQVHFHTPSEHQIDGVTFPMEMHIVNSIEPNRPGEPSAHLVISVLFKMGTENRFIQSFLSEVPFVRGGGEIQPGHVYLDEIDLTPIPEYYHYQGSLTTPPHTETVDWLVFKEPIQASPDQIRRINLIEGDNARHIQALYDRPVDE